MKTTELLNALRPFANIASDPALMADVLRGMRPHEAATLREALKTARLLVEQHCDAKRIETYRWVAQPNRPYQQVGNEYEIVPLTEEAYDRYIRPISGVDRSLEEYLRLWDERPDEVEGAKPTHVLLSRTEQEPEMRAFRVGPLDCLREYMEARERVGWFRRVDAFDRAELA